MAPLEDEGGVILAWNPHTGNRWSNVRQVLADEVARDRPGVIVLNEVKHLYGRLDQWAERHAYVCHQEEPRPQVAGKPVPERGSTAVLIDSALGILSARVVTMETRWKVFSHNRLHEPRRGWQIRYRDNSGRWKGRFVHGPTNGFTGGNRTAFAEFAALMRAALTRKAAGVVSLAVSDHNERVRPLRKWARLFGARVAGHGVDSCLVVGGTVTAETAGKHGSDHELMRYRVTRST